MKSSKTLMYIIEIILLVISMCFIFFADIFTKSIISIVLLTFVGIFSVVVKNGNIEGRYNKKITPVMILIGIMYVVLIYILGIYIGFNYSTVKFSKWSVTNYILPYILIIVSIEVIRKKILLKEYKKSNILILIITIIIDIATKININTVETLNDYFVFLGFVLFSSIANNILFNYIIIKYKNCKAIIVYRLILTLYPYIIPITPNIHILFESVLKVVIPYIIYLILEMNYAKKEIKFSRTKKTTDLLITFILIIITAVILMLVSCQFKYGALVIASESMTGTINKGDVIIYERLDEEINIGDIIVFNNENMKIIHRVVNKKNNGTKEKYYTKGDANLSNDEGYRTKEDIIGKVKLRIPYIGQITVLINELFN